VFLGDNHYLYQLRAACLAQPALNAHQLVAIDHSLDLAAAASNVDEFIQQSKQLFELARATCLDRAANLHRAALALDDPWLGAAAAAQNEAILAAGTHAELIAPVAHPGFAQSAEFHSLVRQLYALPNEANLLRPRILALDPDFDSAPARHRWRVPWLGAGPAPPPGPLFEQTKPILVGPTFATPYLERQSLWHEPLLAELAQRADSLIRSSSTPISNEASSTFLCFDFQISACWNQLLLDTLLAPFTAALENTFEPNPGNLHQTILRTHQLTGFPPHAILTLPRIQFFFAHNLDAPPLEGSGAFDGEGGFPFLRALRAYGRPPDWDRLLPALDLNLQPVTLYYRDRPFPIREFVIPSLQGASL